MADYARGSLRAPAAKCKSFRSNDGYIRQPNERQHSGKIALVMLKGRCGRAWRIDIAARGSDENLLGFGQQTFSAICAVTESLAGNTQSQRTAQATVGADELNFAPCVYATDGKTHKCRTQCSMRGPSMAA
jgi:hypothetical protein